MSQPVILREILQAHFRANPGYELVLFDRLSDAYRTQFAALQADADFYGVLWPQVPGLPLKAVDRETALLFFTLQQPGLIPGYVRASFGERCNQAIAELVLDGVLEVALAPDGEFASGAAAHHLIHETRAPVEPGGRIARLSLEAIEYGQALAITSSAELSARLYAYNTLPASPAWRRLAPTPDAVPVFLGIDAGGRNRPALDRWYAHTPAAQENAGWRVWRLRSGGEARGAAWRPRYKLYISPRPEALREVIGTIINALGAARVTNFKIGRDVHGLLRPDKIVAYCAEFEELAALAAGLQEALAGCPAQGVPFSAGIDPVGLLSWGTDPPRETQEFAGLEQESWRLWVTNRLAVALLAAKTQPTTVRPSAFALERLRLDGVDTDSWTPRQAIWQGEGRG